MKRLALVVLIAVAGSAPLRAQDAAVLDALVHEAPEQGAAPSVLVASSAWSAHRAQESSVVRGLPAAWRPRSARLNWIDYSLLAATGAAAVLAIHYKFEADALYEDYVDTGDPELRARIRSLDTRSGVATAGMQVGVLTFGVRLLLR